MFRDYLEMIQQRDGKKPALIIDDNIFTYEMLADAAQTRKNEKRKETGSMPNRQPVYIKQTSVIDQLVCFLAYSGTCQVPVIVPENFEVTQFFSDIDIPVEAVMGVATSGSTGTPKILYRTMESWTEFFDTQNDCFGIGQDTVLFMQGSLCFTGNLNMILAAFYAGATVIMNTALDPRKWIWSVQKYDVSVIYLIPNKLLLLLRVQSEHLPSVRYVISGSQRLGASQAEQLKQIMPMAEIILYYGASELSYISWYRFDGEKKLADNCVGKVFDGITVDIAQDGEILVTTPYAICGISMPYSVKDVGHMDENGYLYFDGRADDVLNIGGEKISIQWLEFLIMNTGMVQDAVVWLADEVLEDNRITRKNIQALVVLEPGFAIMDIKKMLQKKISSSLIPGVWQITSEIPKNESGKNKKR